MSFAGVYIIFCIDIWSIDYGRLLKNSLRDYFTFFVNVMVESASNLLTCKVPAFQYLNFIL